MKVRSIVLILALCFVGVAVCSAADAQMGTWKLNEAKSKFAPGTPKNTTVVYEAAGERVKVTIDGIGSDGKPMHNEWTGKFDGKDYPVTAIRIQTHGRSRRSTTVRWVSTSKMAARPPLAVALSCLPTARAARSPRAELIRMARRSAVRRSTTSNSGNANSDPSQKAGSPNASTRRIGELDLRTFEYSNVLFSVHPPTSLLRLSRRHLSATGSPLDVLTLRGEGEQTQNA